MLGTVIAVIISSIFVNRDHSQMICWWLIERQRGSLSDCGVIYPEEPPVYMFKVPQFANFQIEFHYGIVPKMVLQSI